MPDEPAADRAYRQTKEMVLSGDLPGGRLLSEGEIAERLGMSRTPVREAFLRLQAEDLLSLIPKRGAVVVPVSPDEAEDVLDAREAIEVAAVRRLLRTPIEVDRAVTSLHLALQVQQHCAEQNDLDGFVAADEEFHRTIVTAGRNAVTTRFYENLADRQRRMSMRVTSASPQIIDLALAQHAQLIGIIESGDELRFATALREHLNGTHRR